VTSATGDSDDRADGQSEVDRAGAGRTGANGVEYVESAVSACSVGPGGDDEALAVALFRRRVLRVLAGCLVAVLLAAAGVGGWLWWTRPLTREVPLPDGVESGEVWQIGTSVGPARTEAGTLREGPLRSERHQWIGSLEWTRSDGVVEIFELRLGDTVHIDGLGVVTLLDVMPEPLLPDYRAGFWTYTVNVTLDPGVELMW